jgi:hypothetical protein
MILNPLTVPYDILLTKSRYGLHMGFFINDFDQGLHSVDLQNVYDLTNGVLFKYKTRAVDDHVFLEIVEDIYKALGSFNTKPKRILFKANETVGSQT